MDIAKLKDKALRSIQKLLELTQQNKLEWQRIADTGFLTRGTNYIIDVAYTTKHGGVRFLIYEYKFQNMDSDERLYWDNGITVSVVDERMLELWTFPVIPAAWDLLNAARFNSAKIDEKLDNFLQDED